jgi:dipeptidyl aminopeptidase/acylaminoacyl peptidase
MMCSGATMADTCCGWKTKRGEFSSKREKIVFCTRNDKLYLYDFKTQSTLPIMPRWSGIASPVLSPDERWVMYVNSNGVTDLLAVSNTHGTDLPRQLLHGADFYMQPCLHPDGELIAWTEWNHPYMPWEASSVKIGVVGGMQLHLNKETWIAGDENLPAHQPQFSPDGKWLSFIQSNGEWDNLILLRLEDKKRRVLIHGKGFLLSTPAWVQGMRSYGWSHDSCDIYSIRNFGGQATLWKVNVRSRKSHQIETSPYTWLSQLAVSPTSHAVAFLASAPHIPKRVVFWEKGELGVIAESQPYPISVEFIPKSQEITWKANNGTTLYGWYYPPTNSHYSYQGAPPLIVEVHSGPTSQRALTYAGEIAYFTSRGYAIMQVNYRGSSGYGYSYQNALKHKWGLVDVEDAVSAAQVLIERGLADKERLAILGSSAGGTTVLNTLIRFPDFFKAGICCYGTSNLITDAHQTHKFEKHYHSFLIGSLKEDIERFRERSPIFNLEKIHTALAVFHGENDKVVAPSQSEQIVANLRKRGVPYIYRLYKDEGHGFRKQETLEDYYQQVDTFLRKYLIKKK